MRDPGLIAPGQWKQTGLAYALRGVARARGADVRPDMRADTRAGAMRADMREAIPCKSVVRQSRDTSYKGGSAASTEFASTVSGPV